MTSEERDKHITQMTGRTADQDFELADQLIAKMAGELDGHPHYIALMAVTRLLARISVVLGLPKDEALHLISIAPDWMMADPVAALLRMLEEGLDTHEPTVFDRKDED